MQREQTHRASGGAAGRTSNEFVDGSGKRKRALFDVLAQRIPRFESVLACDHRLGIVQGETGGAQLGDGLASEGGEQTKALERAGIRVTCSVQQRFGLLLELFEIRPLGQRR
jgi:hypothetical protein